MATRRGNGEGSAPRQRADGRWGASVAWTDQHGSRQRTYVYGKDAKEVRAKIKEITGRLSKGQPGRDARQSLAVYVESWISGSLAASDRKASTKANYAMLARGHIVRSTLGTLTLDRITPSHVEAWVVELRARGLSESSVRQVYTILRSVLDTAVRDGLVAENKAAVVKRPKVTHREAAYLSPEQVRSLLAAASTTRYLPLFELLVNTGLRRGEALALKWTDIDFDNHHIRVRGTLARVGGNLVVTAPKTTKSRRVIPMTETAAEVLSGVRRRQLEERLAAGSKWSQTGFVFTSEFGTPAEPRNALRALKAAAKQAELPSIGLHTLRHSAASVMLTHGVPLKVVSEILGHASIAVTADTYGHVSPDVSRSALDTLSAALG